MLEASSELIFKENLTSAHGHLPIFIQIDIVSFLDYTFIRLLTFHKSMNLAFSSAAKAHGSKFIENICNLHPCHEP